MDGMAQPGPSGGGGDRSTMTSELESFRQQWRAEVQAKASALATTGPVSRQAEEQHKEKKTTQPRPVDDGGEKVAASAARTAPSVPETPTARFSAGKKPVPPGVDDDDDDDDAGDDSGSDSGADAPGRRYSFGETTAASARGAEPAAAAAADEPRSALEHYEKAVEREEQGSLGDSVRLYRQAFRMDSAVDKTYKNKHFPVTATAAITAPAPGSAAVPAAAEAPPPPPPPLPATKDLIASFAGLAIEGAPPPVEGDPPPPCPLAALPDELLVHVLRDVAVADVGDFVRLAQVCKKLAFLVATEDRLWRRVCVGPEFGFAAMHRTWQRSIAWGPPAGEDETDAAAAAAAAAAASLATTLALRGAAAGGRRTAALSAAAAAAAVPAVYPSWQHMFRRRPRIRFNGCYISTVNYVRPGQATANMVTWTSPVLIVTYFRYLRFFRDGTVISLVTTAEPADVVHHLTKELLALHRGGAMASLPSAVMQSAWKGRWRLSALGGGDDDETGPAAPSAAAASAVSSLAAAADAEGDLEVETEGVGKYHYRLALSVRSAGKGTRNTKLVWRGFYSYDRLTDDWGEFGLKNDRPFFFSRVKSYGVGG